MRKSTAPQEIFAMVCSRNGIFGLNGKGLDIDDGTNARCESPRPGIIDACNASGNSAFCRVPKTHMVVLIEGLSAPLEKEGGKPIPKEVKSTINSIRSQVVNHFNEARSYKRSMQCERLAIEAYASDTVDDVKILAIDFIKTNHQNNGRNNIEGVR
jgi:hypothetical protein